MIKVLGRADSLNVRKVLWALEELGLSYTREDYGGQFGRTNDTEYRSLNPPGLVPTLINGDVAVWESNTIVRYLADVSSAEHFIGCDATCRARISQWMDWQLGIASSALQPLFHQLVRTEPMDRNTELIAAKLKESTQAMMMLDNALGTDEFITGENITAADIALGVYVHRYYTLEIPRPTLTQLSAYHKRLSQRPSYARNVAIAKP